MTTVSRSIPTSPCSSCSLNSSRSDWFRQSVLFWSSQSERSDECTNDRYCKCHGSESFASSQMSLLSNLSPRSRNSPRSSTKNSPKSPAQVLSPSKSLSPPQGLSPTGTSTSRETKDTHTTSVDYSEHKLIEYDPSDLLRQVAELERCFEKSPAGSSTTSPILTLEFPTGSAIKTNPLYHGSNTASKTCTPRVAENFERSEIVNFEKNDEDDIPQCENNEREIIESIQDVQNTLMELSREIEETTSGANTARSITSNSEIISTATITTTVAHSTATILENINTVTINKEQSLDSTIDQVEQHEKSNESSQRDPNTILRDLLSTIKPPPSTDVINKGSSNRAGKILNKKISQHDAVSTEELLRKIDDIMQFKNDSQTETSLKCPQYNRDRLDSGLQSTSSESTSPFPSPDVTKRALSQVRPKPERRFSCNSNFQTVREVLNEKTTNSVFPDDSDFSDCSPMSTLDSARGTTASVKFRPRSQSVSNCQYKTSHVVHEPSSTTKQNIEKSDLSTSQLQRLNDKHEAETVQKFIALADQQKDSASKLESISIDDVSLIFFKHRCFYF